MIIESSMVNMASSRSSFRYERKEHASISERADGAVALDLSEDAKSLSEQLKEHETKKEEELKKQQEENQKKWLENTKKILKEDKENAGVPQTKEGMKYQMLRELIAMMQDIGKNGFSAAGQIRRVQANYARSLAAYSKFAVNAGGQSGAGQSGGVPASSGTLWTKTTVQSSFLAESEATSFQSSGVAKTVDGREIRFGVSVEMSRSFCAKYESFTQENYFVTDPLVINVGADTAGVSDMKFRFDLDADGEEEEISFAGAGSGFLALDKNNDGKINDGSELFGTKSGDGFKDLAAYDEDGNGWIDEADSIFKDLKVWTKDEDGNDHLMDLKSANVGAIYLGSANTHFSVNDDKNHTDAIIRKTGIYLKEDGGVGTVQHMDLTHA